MTPIKRRFMVSARTAVASGLTSLRSLLRMPARVGDFALQQMCPSCGLITPRHELCLPGVRQELEGKPLLRGS